MAASGVLDPLRRSIESRLGLSTSTFGYASFGRFEAIADRLSAFIDDVATRHTNVSLVGHSLGGLLTRYYAQELDRVPTEPHDVRLDAVLTEAGFLRCVTP